MGYETQLRDVNFRSIYDTYGAYTGVLDLVSGKYTISYMMPTTGININTLDFGASGNYYSDAPYNNLTNNFEGLTGSQQAAVDLILSSGSGYTTFFSDVAQVAFNKKTSGTEAAIIIGQHPDTSVLFEPDDVAVSFVENGGMLAGGSAAIGRLGDVWLNEDFGWSGVATPGTEQFFAILHELAHSVGALKHIDDTGDISLVDNQQYSVLSYNPLGWANSTTPTANALYNDNETSPLYAYGLQLYDIANLQNSSSMYGANTTTRTGDTTYKLAQGLGRDNDPDKAFIYTVWDSGGDDTIDASDFADYRARINLNDGEFSSIGSTGKSVGGVYRQGFGLTAGDATSRDINNVAIAYGAVIENAIGGDQDDDITGNEWGNSIWGDEGDDTLAGEEGNDIVDAGDGNDFIIVGAGQWDQIYGGAGTDIFAWDWRDYGTKDIYDDWLEDDFIFLGAGVTRGMLSFSTFGDDLRVTISNGISDHGAELWIKDASMTQSDFLSYHSLGVITTALPYTPTGTTPLNSNDVIVNGTSGNDSLSGGAAIQTFNGGAGDDIITLGGGDTGNGDGDRDKMTGAGYMYGGAAGDWLEGGITMDGGTGDDYIIGGSPTTSISGGAGNDTIQDYASGSAVTIDAGGDDDWIKIGGTGTVAQGGGGNDVFSVTGSGAAIDGGLNDDVIHLDADTSKSITITAGQGDDIIYWAVGYWDVTVNFASGANFTGYQRAENQKDLIANFADGSSLRISDYYGHEYQSDWHLPCTARHADFFWQ